MNSFILQLLPTPVTKIYLTVIILDVINQDNIIHLYLCNLICCCMIGGYWQWGRKGPDPSQWYDTNTPNFAHGPTGPGLSKANEAEISTWDTTYAPDVAWSDSIKTANDSCPEGFRVPTISQWRGVIDNSTQSPVGTWSSSIWDPTNYSAARSFGDSFMLPAAGSRYYYSEALGSHGTNGIYWGSSESSSDTAWCLAFDSSVPITYFYGRSYSFSVRCIAK